MDRVRDLLKSLIGGIAWGVARGHGSVFHMEFGAPHLVVREPVAPKQARTAEATRALQRRSVYVRGDWSFWVDYGDWSLRTRGGEIDCTISAGSPADACLRDLEGQKLLSVGPGTKANSSILTFDLGAVLAIWPSAEIQDSQWSLHAWNGRIATFRHDGSLAFENAKRGSGA